MEDEIDIYEDLPSFDTKESEKEVKELSQKCDNFQREVAELKLKLAELSESNKLLSTNFSSLLKTAKAEISRKDRMISELRQQLDNRAFRRSGYAKPKVQTNLGKLGKDNRYNPIVRIEALPPATTQPVLLQGFENEIEDTEQKYEPEKVAKTVFGERLRKKILMEEEAERLRKEEARLAMLEKKAVSEKSDVEVIKENGIASNIVRKEPQEVPKSLVEEIVFPGKSAPSSNGSSLQSYEEDDKNLSDRRDFCSKLLGKRINKDAVYSEQKRRRIDDERYHSDDTWRQNGNAKHDSRFNAESSESCRASRDSAKHVNHRRGSGSREEVERTRQAHGERSKLNYRSRSRTPDRRYGEKRSDRHRTDKYRAYMDTYEKRRHEGLNRSSDYGNKFSKNPHDLRAKIDHRAEANVGGRSEYDNYKSSKFDRDSKRGARKSPTPEKSRKSSNGRIKGKTEDKVQAGRSRSSNRLTNGKSSEEPNKELEGVKTRSHGRETIVADRKDLDAEPKVEDSFRTGSDKEATNKQLVSSAPLPDDSGKQVTEKSLVTAALSSDDLALVVESDKAPEEIKKQRKGTRRQSRESKPAAAEEKSHDSEPKSETPSRTSSEKEATNKEVASSALLPSDFEKEAMNNQLVSSKQFPDGSASLEGSAKTPEEIKQGKGARRKSKEIKPSVVEENDNDSEPKPQTPTRKRSAEKEVTNKEVALSALLSLGSEKDVTKKEVAPSALLPDGSEKEETNKQLTTILPSPDCSVLVAESDKASEEMKKQRKGARRRSKESKPAIAEEKDRETEPKAQSPKKESSEKEATSSHLASSTPSPEAVASAKESEKVPEEAKKQRKSARRKSKESKPAVAEEKNRELKSLSPTKASSEKEATAEESDKKHEEMKKQRKSARRRSKDSQPTIAEENDRDSGSKSETPTKTGSGKEATNKELASCVSVAEVLALNMESDGVLDEQKALSAENMESAAATLQNVLGEVDSPGKWISSVLENDPAAPSISSAILAPDNIGSRSFREEKIENIEKFIQSYQDHEDLYCRIVKKDSEELDRQDKSCISTNSILDTLSMDIEIGEPEDGVLENSIINEQLLLESLSTPIKKNEPPLPPLPPPDETKQPPLPPLPPPDEVKQPPLPPTVSPEELKQQSLPPLPSSEEEKEQTLPPLPSAEEKEQTLPPLPSAEEKEQILPPLPSAEEKEKTLPPLPSAEEKEKTLPPLPAAEEKEHALPPLPSLNEEEQPQPPLPSSNEKKKNLQSLLSPDEEKLNLQPVQSTDDKRRSPPPLPSPDIKQQPPPPPPDTENQVLPPLPTSDKKKQHLPSTSPSGDQKLRLSPSNSSPDVKKRISSPSLSPANRKQRLPPSPPSSDEKPQKSSQQQERAPEEINDLSLSPKSAPEDKTKLLLSTLPSSSEKEDLASLTLPAPSEKEIPPSSTRPASSEKVDLILTTQPAPDEKKGPVSSQPENPRDKKIENSVISASKTEPEKTRTENAAPKQINRRHRIPCVPIVSRYSRKRRGMVLTDSEASQCIIKSDSSTDPETNNNAEPEIDVLQIVTKEPKVATKLNESSEPVDIPSEKCSNNTKVEISEETSKALKTSAPENALKILPQSANAISEHREQDKIISSSHILVTTIPEDGAKISEQPEINCEEPQPTQLVTEDKTAPTKLRSLESSIEAEKQKPLETRGTRSALKTIAPPRPGGDALGVSSSRKRPLPKEKENQSKQLAKQCKIMVVTRRRRPVQLEDSSTATTLVPSAQDANCDQPSKNNSVKNNSSNGEKPDALPTVEVTSKGRKRRSADK